MFRRLQLRDRLVAMAAVPIVAVAVVAAGLLIFVNDSSTRPYGIFAAVCLVLSGAVAIAIARSVTESVNELAEAARTLARDHHKVAAGELSTDELSSVEVSGNGPIAEVAAAINDINDAAIAVNESQQGAVKEGLSNIVVNLARRSQTLLDRQVEYLDRLESTEEDPERLGELFKVDHLATRMRRNAESLMVLAEADPGRRRGGPVEVADVLRVAMGEVENYQHIDLIEVDDGQVGATVAVDLAHMAAELMENATQFSPPDTPVDVSGTFAEDGRFSIVIADSGMGMTGDKLTEANQVLADPPELGLAMGRSLGFIVIGRLAKRLGAEVELQDNGDAGLKAVITVPGDLVIAGTGPTETSEPSEATDSGAESKSDKSEPAPAPESETTSQGGSAALERLLGINGSDGQPQSGAPEDWASKSPFESADDTSEGDGEGESWTPPEVTSGPPRKLEEAVPSGDAFESGVASLLEEDGGKETGRSLRDEDATSAGLAKRQRGASQVPIGQGRPVTASTRDPDEVRSMLSRYREGLKGNKSGGDVVIGNGDPAEDSGSSDSADKTKDR